MTPPRIVPVAPLGRVLRMVRIAADLSMGEAARMVGLDVVAWSTIENGRATLENDTAWCELYAALAAEHERREDERRARRASITPPG